MQGFFSLGNLIAGGGYVIAGILVVLGMFGMQVRARRAENDNVTQNLIDNYKATVEEQDKKLKASMEREIQQGKDLAHLQGQVKILSEILQGRDPAMQKFLAEAPELARVATENNRIAKETAAMVADIANKKMDGMIGAVERLVELLTPKTA